MITTCYVLIKTNKHKQGPQQEVRNWGYEGEGQILKSFLKLARIV